MPKLIIEEGVEFNFAFGLLVFGENPLVLLYGISHAGII